MKDLMDKLINRLSNETGDKLEISLVGFNVNRWGSCQYSTALDLFDILTTLQNQIGLQETLKEIGFSQLPNVLLFEESKKRFIKMIDETYCDDIFDDKKEKLIQIKNIKNVDQMFDFCRDDDGWDLWTATPQIAKCVFDKEIKLNYKSPGIGPDWNVIVQSENYNVGFLCWLMCKVKEIVNESSFEDFDT